MLFQMLDEAPGQIRWVDLTVNDANKLSEFYQAVVGWVPSSVPVGSHEDWSMYPPDSPQPVAGICHASGLNAGLPPVWLIYITVSDLAASIEECKQRGGEIIFGPRIFGTEGKWCVIRDPAGAVAALFEGKAVA